MFGLFIDRIRVDLGEDTFIEGDPTNVPILTDESLKKLITKIKVYIQSKKGSIVEFDLNEGVFSVDTPDLTLTCKIEECDREGGLTKKEISVIESSFKEARP